MIMTSLEDKICSVGLLNTLSKNSVFFLFNHVFFTSLQHSALHLTSMVILKRDERSGRNLNINLLV